MKSNDLFVWNYIEDAFLEVKMDFSYDASLDLNVLFDGTKTKPAIISDVVFRRTMTVTKVKKETNDVDEQFDY